LSPATRKGGAMSVFTSLAKSFFGLQADSKELIAAKRCRPSSSTSSSSPDDDFFYKKTDPFMRGAIVPMNDDSSDLLTSKELEKKVNEIYGKM